MIISKDLFIFGEQIFATIIPEGGAALATQQQQQQPAIINTATATAAEQVVEESLKAAVAAAAAASTLPAQQQQQQQQQLPAAVNTKTSSSTTATTTTTTTPLLLLTKQETVAVVAAANNNINNNNNNISVATKIQKIPQAAEELIAKKPKAKCQEMPMNLLTLQSVDQATKPTNHQTIDSDNESSLSSLSESSTASSATGMEQVPLVASRRNLAKIVAANDCRLQIESPPIATAAIVATVAIPTPPTPPPPPAAAATVVVPAAAAAAATEKTSCSSASSTSSSSASSSSSSSTSSEFTHTSQTTLPSSDNLSAAANLVKTCILSDAKSVAQTPSLTFPIKQQQQQEEQQQPIAQQIHQQQLQQQQQQQKQQQQQQQLPTLQLTFQNLSVLHNERKILSDVSGLVSPGEVLAIMGPSGSGKTTLLDCLSGQRHFDSGSVYLNREPLSKRWRRKIGYVLQDEIFFTQLTLRETVMYTALLRLPESMARAEKLRLVDHILDTLELTCCQQTKFGDYLNRGLSGGEKKRANIACELLTNPLLMLLDEPTSGLDSHSAISLMKVLKRYAQLEQKTIVISVHQPSSQMFHMFDKLLLLHQGCTAYFGEVNNIYRHFEDIGVTIKPHYNPADFVLEQLKSHPDIREKLFIAARESHSNYLNRNCISSRDKSMQHDTILINDIIHNYYNQRHHNHHHHRHHHHHQYADLHHTRNGCEADEEAAQHLVWCGADSQSNFSSCASSDCQSYRAGKCSASDEDWLSYPTRFHTQFSVLSSRNFKEAKPRMLSKLNWFQTIGLALMAGAIWFQLPRTEEFLHDLQGWMFFSQTYWMLFALFGALNSFPSEREVISKERRSGAYRLSAYYLAKMCAELPLVITLPTVYLMISYPMLGCSSLKLFFLMLIFLLLNTIVAQSVGFFIGACCMDMNVSITLSALYTLATQLFGGYLSSRIPEGLSWIRYTSMIHYAYQNMQILEFREGPAISCGSSSSYEICKQQTTEFIPYEEILKAQNSTSPLWLNTLILMMFFLVFRGLGYAVLRYLRCPKKT